MKEKTELKEDILKNKIWTTIKKRLKNNFIDKNNLLLFGFIFIFFTIAFMPFFYEWKTKSYMLLGIALIINFFFDFLFFGLLYQKPGFRSYLIFWFIFSLLMIAFDMIRYDVSSFKSYFGSVGSVESIIKIVQPIFMLSFLSTNFVLFILLLIINFVGFLEASIIIKLLKKGFLRFFGSIFFEIIIFTFFYFTIEGIRGFLGSYGTLSNDQELIHLFEIDSLYQQTSENNRIIISSISGMLFLMWIPIFMKINKTAKGQIFPNYNREISLSFLLIFISKLLGIGEHLVFYPSLFIVVSVFSFISFFNHLYYIFKSFYLNWKIRKNDVYIPFTSSNKNVKNPFVKGFLLIKDKKSFRGKINILLEQFV